MHQSLSDIWVSESLYGCLVVVLSRTEYLLLRVDIFGDPLGILSRSHCQGIL